MDTEEEPTVLVRIAREQWVECEVDCIGSGCCGCCLNRAELVGTETDKRSWWTDNERLAQVVVASMSLAVFVLVLAGSARLAIWVVS